MNWDTMMWLILMVVFIIIEAACPVHLVSIWFAIGSVVALIVSLFAGQLWLQITLFLIVSVVFLAAMWPVAKKFLNPNHVSTNLDAMIGSTGKVTQPIDNVAACGQVKLGAMYWTARSTSGEAIDTGVTVKVDRIEGVKAFVSPIESKVKL